MPEKSEHDFVELFNNIRGQPISLDDILSERAACYLLAGFFHGWANSLRPITDDDIPLLYKAVEIMLKVGELTGQEVDRRSKESTS